MKDPDLLAREVELGKELMEMRFSHAISQLADTAKMGRTRRDLARIKTEIQSRPSTKVGGSKVRNKKESA